MSDVALTSTQLSQLNAIIATQSQLAPQNQDWTDAYALIANAIQGTSVSSGVTYFFQTAGGVNGNSSNSAANLFIRTYFTTAAALQGVILTDNQVQAVSGNIGLAIFQDIANAGVVPGTIDSIVDNDISNAVTNIPGVSQQLSFATWGASLFAESQLGYTGFYDKYFTTPQDWQIFYQASEAACAVTGLSLPTQADAQAVEACIGVFAAASGYAEMQDNAAMAQGIQLLINAAGAATDLLWNALFPPANGAQLSQNDLDSVDAFGASSVVNGNLVVTLNSGASATGLLTITPDGNGSVSIDGTTTQFNPSTLLNISNDAPANLTLSLAPSLAGGLAQAIDINASTGDGSLEIAGDSIGGVPTGSSISVGSGSLTATGSLGGSSTDDTVLNAAGGLTENVSTSGSSATFNYAPSAPASAGADLLVSATINGTTYTSSGSASVSTFVTNSTAPTDNSDQSAELKATQSLMTSVGNAVGSVIDSGEFANLPDPLSLLTSDGSTDQIYYTQGWDGNGLDFNSRTVFSGMSLYDSSSPSPDSPITGTDYNILIGYDDIFSSPGTPLVLSIDKGGINLVPLDQSQAHFDYAGNGVSIHTGWVGANTGIRRGDLVFVPGMSVELEPNACLGTKRVNIGAAAIVTETGAEALNDLPTRVYHRRG